MKPVDPTKLDKLLQDKPVLMLDVNELSANFIETTIRRSPDFITTKKGKKTLPLELWLEILEWTRRWSCNLLVQPQRLEEGSIDIIVCAEIPSWKPCACLKNASAVRAYESYLDQPGDGPDENRPFCLPQDITEDSTWKIPVTALSQDDMILCGELRVPDVIAFFEDGKCYTCGQGRIICPGCGFGYQIAESFGFYQVSGLEYTAEDLCLTDERNEGEEGCLTDEEYDAWVQSRFRELGY
ncbi:uncharacterized protein NECHADRAFT_82508 [Fusarium vanettenii 77-13-4]|uniref:Uncharacterized protein n=1 Tax=Fusarium vanettenii (strain ATCC MYA-4622 / CBS 123669 / FGSC 9596 / NRRL 45880 / 77-13-4) TaxID=660122 RepID=C7YXF2_FUSV7|nr:uncharacterized protein NECHADRAFT_82508 [Fusarium vanettenii 77-13-4]EEU43578.1 predicted protein [Fusarium vanettenii 77-13-4]